MNKNDKNQWHFQALDTLFFRESRPMESIGGAQLQSVFPPPARTIIGAIRRIMGEAYGVDWKEYETQADHPLKAIMGSADSLSPLSFKGVFLMNNGKRLFPVPLALLEGDTGFTRLEPSEKFTECDLGLVRLPKKKDTSILGVKPLENAWMDEQGLLAFLNGDDPFNGKTYSPKDDDLFDREERIGIGRDSAKGVVEKSLLYSTQHIRPKKDIEKDIDIGIGIVINGLELSKLPNLPEKGISLLGSEGRMASWVRQKVSPLPTVEIKGKNIVLVLLSHAKFKQGWLPDGLEKIENGTFEGEIAGVNEITGVKLRLISAVIGKPVREGGWDLVNRKPRAMDSFVPAGSCYFCEVLNDADIGNISQLNGMQIGQDTRYGRGEIIVGNW